MLYRENVVVDAMRGVIHRRIVHALIQRGLIALIATRGNCQIVQTVPPIGLSTIALVRHVCLELPKNVEYTLIVFVRVLKIQKIVVTVKEMTVILNVATGVIPVTSV